MSGINDGVDASNLQLVTKPFLNWRRQSHSFHEKLMLWKLHGICLILLLCQTWIHTIKPIEQTVRGDDLERQHGCGRSEEDKTLYKALHENSISWFECLHHSSGQIHCLPVKTKKNPRFMYSINAMKTCDTWTMTQNH